MPKYIQRAYTERVTHYERRFDLKGGNAHCGYAFKCDKDGKVDFEGMNPAGRENYLRCIMGVAPVIDYGVESYETSYRHRAIIACENCGDEVWLGNFTNTCRCGTDYNMSGHRLASRSQWGEETGEHWTECY